MPEGNTFNWLVGNHDKSRIDSRFTPEVIDAFKYAHYTFILCRRNWNDIMQAFLGKQSSGCNDEPDRYNLFSRDPSRTPMKNDETNAEAQRNTDGDSHLKVYKRISLEAMSIEDGAAFGYSRIFKGKGFLYLANFHDEDVTINASQLFEGIPERATVHVTSINFLPETAVGSDINIYAVVIGPSHTNRSLNGCNF